MKIHRTQPGGVSELTKLESSQSKKIYPLKIPKQNYNARNEHPTNFSYKSQNMQRIKTKFLPLITDSTDYVVVKLHRKIRTFDIPNTINNLCPVFNNLPRNFHKSLKFAKLRVFS